MSDSQASGLWRKEGRNNSCQVRLLLKPTCLPGSYGKKTRQDSSRSDRDGCQGEVCYTCSTCRPVAWPLGGSRGPLQSGNARMHLGVGRIRNYSKLAKRPSVLLM